MKVGDIYWVDLPGTDGRTQFGRRPAIILRDEKYSGNLPTVLVIPLTSAQKALRFAGTTQIVASSESGLTSDSIALVFQCLAIDRKNVCQKTGQVSDQECSTVLAELSRLIGQGS